MFLCDEEVEGRRSFIGCREMKNETGRTVSDLLEACSDRNTTTRIQGIPGTHTHAQTYCVIVRVLWTGRTVDVDVGCEGADMCEGATGGLHVKESVDLRVPKFISHPEN